MSIALDIFLLVKVSCLFDLGPCFCLPLNLPTKLWMAIKIRSFSVVIRWQRFRSSVKSFVMRVLHVFTLKDKKQLNKTFVVTFCFSFVNRSAVFN